ncbi:Hint domain-containing protein [Sulfitobacter aestuariivivens]|uniref:Hint domain-containing protein n=1 Tax=Sulfitobacter aestuariivivens TaxID=2766981 RepID=A0A927D369_9RHOB|nr:Hint domain-containing protein [Sulfitobacter aestuariivivens]MBD3664290.1 Hint domain-containing protein [Sulfitobacter aestuariivivens]
MFGWNNRTNGINRRALEMTGAYDGGLATQTHGLMAGTVVASNLGWRPIEALAIGDKVLTFDNGMQEITEIRRMTFWTDAPHTDAALWPVTIPVGALGNRQEMTLLADQGVLVESDAASDVFGDPFAVIPAHSLDGVRGITRAAPAQQIELIAVYFEKEQVIYADGGALVHCPAPVIALDTLIDGTPACYDVLGPRDAAWLAECMVMEDRMLATGGAGGGRMAAH